MRGFFQVFATILFMAAIAMLLVMIYAAFPQSHRFFEPLFFSRWRSAIWHWFVYLQCACILFGYMPLYIAYMRHVHDRHTYWWKVVLFGWMLPGFIILMLRALTGRRDNGTASKGYSSVAPDGSLSGHEHKIHLINES